MAHDKDSSKQRKRGLTGETQARSDAVTIMDVKQIRMHPTFEGLLPISEGLLGSMTRDMKENGFYDSEPLVLGHWSGLTEPVLIDGHARLRAAIEAGITHVPIVIKEFRDEVDALQHAMTLQSKRRSTRDSVLYRLCERCDRLLERGRPRKDEEEGKIPPHGGNNAEHSASARRTAQFIGCHYRKVDKIRKIRKDGPPEIQEAVKNDKLSINGAYNKICKMKQGAENSSRGRTKAERITLSEENDALLKELGGDVGTHVNKAVEMYILWLRDKERAKET